MQQYAERFNWEDECGIPIPTTKVPIAAPIRIQETVTAARAAETSDEPTQDEWQTVVRKQRKKSIRRYVQVLPKSPFETPTNESEGLI